MKHTIEEIESMRDLKLKLHEDYGDVFTVEWEIITDLVVELKAIGEIVLKLNFSTAKEAYFKQEILDRTLLQRDKRLTEENKRLREALIGLLEEYENQKSQFGDHGLWIKYELIEKVSLARKALEGE